MILVFLVFVSKQSDPRVVILVDFLLDVLLIDLVLVNERDDSHLKFILVHKVVS